MPISAPEDRRVAVSAPSRGRSRLVVAGAVCAAVALAPAIAGAQAVSAPAADAGVTLSAPAITGDQVSAPVAAPAADPVAAPVLSPFHQALAAAVGSDKVLAEFYQARDWKPLWTGMGDAGRRQAFFQAISTAADQGLPQERYDPRILAQAFRDVQTERDRGQLEARMSRTFLDWAHDVQTGVLRPASISSALVLTVPLRDPLKTIEAFASSDPAGYLAKLPPQMPQYRRLVKAKMDMERLIAAGGWGPTVPGRKLSPGDNGPDVVALRNRLIAMGYLGRTNAAGYDGQLQAAVQLFQEDHGLVPDGVAGPETLGQINDSAEDRLKSIVVALERLRWLNMPWGKRHVWVNEADFTARVVDDGKTTFETRAVIGRSQLDHQSPEFSDQIEFMVVNPYWNVPRSIATKEYLPQLQRNPNAVSYLQVVNAQGQVIDRNSVDFNQYTKNTFPFEMKQPPSSRNALGLVKFMFPNRWNIYLHDTPSKSLFSRNTRDFSHGCIRLNDPFDMAYTLLAPQTNDPKAVFKAALNTGKERTIMLKTPVPVHLTYFTAWPTPKGGMEYRRDVYGRDALIFEALQKAGVALDPLRG
ncbi:L,D-transpeptidase family protein [Acidimangrovimonas sediminis]|uniref:L,D-transpeptidase family protein n=1 Tax=Acidimangrovimonas sediminis TaxID=2056283 RepID=UPI000C7FBDE6|nr:L,D-transpeptidase family protein [Acidimangrovimonas sediminis]